MSAPFGIDDLAEYHLGEMRRRSRGYAEFLARRWASEDRGKRRSTTAVAITLGAELKLGRLEPAQEIFDGDRYYKVAGPLPRPFLAEHLTIWSAP